MGAAAVTKNLSFEFKIAERKEAIEIKNKNGKVILLKLTAKSNLPLMSWKPGETIDKNWGVNISITKTTNKIKKINKFKTWFAK